MTTGATGQLGLALPVQGELSGTWGDTVNNGITQYTNIAIAGTLTLTNDGAVTLANTTGDASASNITSTLTGAGTVTAQFAIVRVTGTLTTAKVVTGPSYSKTYTVVNAATGGIVTFKASGQTGVSVAVGETAFVYFNGTDYVKVAGTAAVSSFSAGTTGLTPNTATTGAVTLAGTLATTNGGTGLTSFTSGGVVYASSSSALATGSVLSFDGTNLGIGTNSPSAKLDITSASAGFSNIKLVQTGVRTWAIENTGTSGLFKIIEAGVSDRLVIDSSGNVGIGTSSPNYKLDVSATSDAIIAMNNSTSVTSGNRGTLTMYNSSGSNVGLIRFAAVTDNVGTEMQFYTRPAAGSLAQTMTLSSAGNLGIGTSSPARKLDVVGAIRSAGVSNPYVEVNNGTSSGYFELRGGSNDLNIEVSGANSQIFRTNNSERARITSGGDLYVGTTTGTIGTGNFGVKVTQDGGIFASRNEDGSVVVDYFGGNAGAFRVLGNGNAENTNNSYGAISDVKLKENIVDASPKLADLMQVKVRNYNLIGDTTKQIGVVAQELETVFPAMVDETNDTDAEGNDLGTTTKAVKYSVFVPMLIKAMQEQQALITQLQADIATLKG